MDASDETGGDVPLSLATTVPYEAVLIKALDRLTSQVFIFLLAYTVLLVLLAMIGGVLDSTLRSILALVPILGVAAYVWLRRTDIATQATEQGIDVRAGWTSGRASVAGVTGATERSALPDHVVVRTGAARDDARVVGVEFAARESELDSAYLNELLTHLTVANQRRLIASAQRLLDKQGDDA